MQTASLCRTVCWVHTRNKNKQANWEALYQTLSHFSQYSEALFALTNPVTKGSESQSLVDLTLPAVCLIPVLEIPPQLQGQLKGPCICSSIAAFHNLAISLYLWWLRALKQCCNLEGAVRQSRLEKGHDVPSSPLCCVLLPSRPHRNAQQWSCHPVHPLPTVAYPTEGQGPGFEDQKHLLYVIHRVVDSA